MDIKDYRVLYPNINVWRSTSECEMEGMLLFDESGDRFAGSFKGGYAYFRLCDYSKYKRWTLLDSSEYDYPTIKNPCGIKLCGTDDASYSKYYPNIKEAKEELELLIDNQPLNFDDLDGFVFTN